MARCASLLALILAALASAAVGPATLRAQDASCPIVVLTAQVLSGMVQESEIADAVASFNLVFSEKNRPHGDPLGFLARAFAVK